MSNIIYREKVAIPEELQFSSVGDLVTITDGKKKKVTRKFGYLGIDIEKKDNEVILSCLNPKKKETALTKTYASHINNMIKGLTEGFEYSMKVIYSHFPVKTKVQGSEFVIENFLGEKHPRKAKILEGVKIKISGDVVTVKGIDKEKVGQTCANIEKATVVKNYDIRVFQDGIYITSKGGA